MASAGRLRIGVRSTEFDFATRQSTLEFINVFSRDSGAEGKIEPPQVPEFRDASETTTGDGGTPFKVERFERGKSFEVLKPGVGDR